MWRRTEARRHLRATVVIATVVMIAGLELGAVFRPKMATASIVRPKMATVGTTWTRNRRFAAPFDPNSVYDSVGRNQNQPLTNREEDGLFLLAAPGFSPRMQRSGAKRSLVGIIGPALGGGRESPFDRKNHRTMTSYPDYVAPQWLPRRRTENNEAIGDLPSLSFGSRTPWKESSSPGKHSHNYYFLASKRQPPPGFHAIRGKRRSDYYENETESETQNETETDDGASSVRQLLADLGELSS